MQILLLILSLAGSAHAQSELEQEAQRLTLELRRHDRYAKVVTVEQWSRSLLPQPNAVTSQLLPGHTGYIRIQDFMPDNMCGEFRRHLRELKAQNMVRLIFDMRGNPGGQRVNGICVAGLLIGQKIVAGFKTLKPLIPDIGRWVAGPLEPESPILLWPSFLDMETEVPIAVILDHDSASAAELVAAALRDHNRAWIVGERSFGKGMVQHYVPLRGRKDLMVRYTYQQFFGPKGESPEGNGVRPTLLTDAHSACVAQSHGRVAVDADLALAGAVLECADKDGLLTRIGTPK